MRFIVIFAYFSSIFNGFFAWVVGYIPDSAPLKKWQYLYLITGSINVLYSLFLCLVLPDSPMNARFLTAEEKFWAVERLASNRTGISNRVWKWDQVREALLDVRIWLIFFFNVAINIPNGGLQAFGTIIISDLGFSSLKASLLTMPFGIVATFGAWFFSYIASLTNRRTFVACAALLLPILGTALVYGLPQSSVAGQLIGLYFMYFYWRKHRPEFRGHFDGWLTYISTLRGWNLPSPSQHSWSNEEGGSVQSCDHRLCRWKSHWAPDVHFQRCSKVYEGRHRDVGLILCFHGTSYIILHQCVSREQAQRQEVWQAGGTS